MAKVGSTGGGGVRLFGYAVPPLFSYFVAAEAQQESGNPKEPGGGAWQFSQPTWDSNAAKAGEARYVGVPVDQVPLAAQRRVADYTMLSYYYGPADQSYRATAMMWNGGTTKNVPNPALGPQTIGGKVYPGGNTAGYAGQVLARMALLDKGKTGTDPATAGAAATVASADTTPSDCVFSFPAIDLGVGSTPSICMDKIVGGLMMAAGSLVILVGAALLVTGLGKGSAATRALAAAPLGPGAAVVAAAGGSTANHRARRNAAASSARAQSSATARRGREDRARQERATTATTAEANRRGRERRARSERTRTRNATDLRHRQRVAASGYRASGGGKYLEGAGTDPPKARARPRPKAAAGHSAEYARRHHEPAPF